jgi:hypothetical protein
MQKSSFFLLLAALLACIAAVSAVVSLGDGTLVYCDDVARQNAEAELESLNAFGWGTDDAYRRYIRHFDNSSWQEYNSNTGDAFLLAFPRPIFNTFAGLFPNGTFNPEGRTIRILNIKILAAGFESMHRYSSLQNLPLTYF